MQSLLVVASALLDEQKLRLRGNELSVLHGGFGRLLLVQLYVRKVVKCMHTPLFLEDIQIILEDSKTFCFFLSYVEFDS